MRQSRPASLLMWPWATLAIVAFHAVAAEESSDEAGRAYLEANGKKDDVITLPSGLQYKILKSGSSNASGIQTQTEVECHYEGKLTTGEVFDSSIQRGTTATFKPNDVVKGWKQALLLMREGDNWELTIPAELAYGSKGAGSKIPPNAVLVFTLEVVKIKSYVGEKHWLEEPIYTIGGFEITRMLIIPPLLAILISIFRAAYLARATYAVARHIVTADERMCYKALSRANKGEDFEELAKEFSTCKSAQKGGKLGKFGRGIMAPEFDKVTFDLKTEIGKPYGPIKTQFGYHVIIVDERHISYDDELQAYKVNEAEQQARLKKLGKNA